MAKHKANDPGRPGKPLGEDRLLRIQDVAELLGVCEPTASTLMKLSGHRIDACRKSYILESNLLAFLKSLEVEE